MPAQFVLVLLTFLLLLLLPTTPLPITSLTQPCTLSPQLFSSFDITTAETIKFNLHSLFSGNNLQLSLSNPNSSQLTSAIIPGPKYELSLQNLSLISTDVYKSQQIVLLVDAFTSNYYVQQLTIPQVNQEPRPNTNFINLSNSLTTKCFSIKYLAEFTVIIDCEDTTNLLNYLYFIDLTSQTVAQKPPTRLLHNNSLSANNRQMQIITQNQNTYVLRTILWNDYNYDILTINHTLIQTYTEITRLIGVATTPSKILIKTLPPIQYPGTTDNMQAVGIAYNSGNLYILDAYSKELYQIQLNFQGFSYYQKFIKIQLQGTINNPISMGTSQSDQGSLFIAYQGAYNTKSGIFLEEINPNTNSFGPVYLLDSSCTTINQILQGSNLLVVSYSGNNKSAISIYLGQPYARYQNYDSNLFAPMIYQQEINSTSIQINPDENTIIASINDPTTNTFTQQYWKLQLPELILASSTAKSAQNIIISCASGYQSVNASNSQNALTAQSNYTFTVNYVQPNYAKVIISPFGKYSTSDTIPPQTLSISVPGQQVIDLDQFYIGALLDYTVQLQISSVSPLGWSNEKASIYKTYPYYTNRTFKFQTIDGLLNPSDIQSINIHYILPNYYLWIIETLQSKLYTFIQKEGENRTLFSEVGLEQDLKQSVGYLIDFAFIDQNQYAYAGTSNPCLLFFLNLNSQENPLQFKTICDAQTQQIQTIKYLRNKLFVIITPTNASSSQSQLLILSPTNKTFTSSMQFNLMFFYVLQYSSPSIYQTVYQDWIRQQIIYIQDKQGISIYDLRLDKFYPYITLFNNLTDYCVALTWSSLIIIQTQSIQEYNIIDLANIYQVRSQFPYYSTHPTYLINPNYYTFSFDLFYIYDSTNQLIQIYRPGADIPMIYMLYEQITFPSGLIFIKLTNQYQEDVEQLTLIGGNSLSIYNIYKRPLLSIEGYFNQSIKQTPQTYNLQLIPVQKVSTSQHQPSPILFSLTTTQTKFTNITFNTSQSLDFIQLKRESSEAITTKFPSFSLFQGTVNNYYLTCIDHPSECNTSIIMQNPLGPQHILSSRIYTIQDVQPGYGNFSFVQTFNRIYRITGQNNLIYDTVQLPFITPFACTNIAVDELGQYSVSACTDFTNNGWRFYVSSYVSSEPHILGFFYDSATQNIQRMIILDNYLFIIDAVFKGTSLFRGIHIYRINFNAGFGDGDATMPQTLPSISNYLGTFTLNTTFSLYDVQSVDILHTSTNNQYRLFFSSSQGTLLTFIIDPTREFQNIVLASSIFKKDLVQIISDSDTEFKDQQNQNIDTRVAGTKAFDFQNSTTTDSYNLIVAFRYLNMYELSVNFQSTQIQLAINIRYLKYAFYEFQNNIIALPSKGFVLISAYLPSYLSGSTSNHSRHLFMAYDRTNQSCQQFTTTQKFTESYVMATYPFKSQDLFKYMAKAFDNGNYAITLVSPDNYYLYAYNLQRQAAIEFKGTQFQTQKIIIHAKSEFYSQEITVQIHKDFSTGSSHKYWIIGAVLGPIAFLVLCFVLWRWYKSRNKATETNQLAEEN